MGTVSTVVGKNSYDGLSAAFNPASGTMWLVGMTGTKDWDVAGLELNGHGVALGSYRIIGQNAGVAQGYVRVAPATTPGWLAVYNRNWQAVMVEATTTSTTAGGSTATFAAYSAGSTSGSSTGTGGASTGGGSTSTPPPAGPSCDGAHKPVASWVCVSDDMGTGWLPPDNPRAIAFLGGGSSTPPPTSTPPQQSQSSSTPPPTASCTTSKPVSSWICVNGGWLPPDHPLAIAYMASHTTSTSQGSTAPPPSNPYAPCVTSPPGSGWVCTAQGNWLPPDNPNAIPAMPTCSSSYGRAPVSGWVRVGDGWLPPDHPGAVNAICKAP
jgi:hypothetical protein